MVKVIIPTNTKKVNATSIAKIRKSAKRAEKRKLKRALIRPSVQVPGSPMALDRPLGYNSPGMSRQPVSAFFDEANIRTADRNSLLKTIHSAPDEKIKDYLRSLIAPKVCMSRIPDAFSRPTALVRSVQVFNVPVNFQSPGTPNDGRFAMCFQPSLGNLQSATNYKAAIIDPSANPFWPTGPTPQQFLTSIDGRDPRLDTYIQPLTQPTMGIWSAVGGAGKTSNLPFGTNVTLRSNYGLSVYYLNQDPTVPGSVFYPPPGQYNVNITILATAGSGTPGMTVTPLGGTTLTAIQYNPSTDGSLFSWSGIVAIPEQAIQSGLGITNSVVGGGALLFSYISFATTFNDNPVTAFNYNSGITSAYRTVGMSALASYVGPVLTNGGNISAAYMARGAAQAQFFATNNQNGSIINWENLAYQTGAYNGPLQDGAYVWWAPEDVQEYQFRDPNSAPSVLAPTIVIAGQWLPGSTVPAGSACVRVELVTVYEIVTESLLLESHDYIGSQQIIDSTSALLAGQTHAMMNAAHINWINSILSAVGKVGKFLYNERDVLLPLASRFAGALL